MWVFLIFATVSGIGAHQGLQNAQHFSNEWVVRIVGGPYIAEILAQELGYTLIGHVAGFPDTYRMQRTDHPAAQKRANNRLTQRLAADARVLWAEQQFAKSRVKRSELMVPMQAEIMFNDELWNEQWYLQDTRTRPDLPKLDLHVLPVYASGVTGKGVRVCVLDDGLEHTHQDLKQNYDPSISYDANDEDEDPTPRYDAAGSNAHGTRCAGEIAMTANNRKCGVGVAFNSRIGGVRLLDGVVNDRVEGVSLGWAHDKIDIYSASWGPNDDGKTVEGPGRLAMEAMERGIKEGRGGKGVIYVWASGNGGSRGDNCNCDGYINSVYTLSVGSASQQGYFPWYGEQCAATFVTTYSSGAYSDQMIATTDLKNSCTIKHTGTSASAPLAAGIIALALEVNPDLTWRDVQHLVAWTAEWAPLSDNRGWIRNTAGFWINTRFGFGLMNAMALVEAAKNWTSVPPKSICTVQATLPDNTTLTHGVLSILHFKVEDSCGDIDTYINFVEHVELQVNIQYSVRGSLEIHLVSAAGTRVQLLTPRKFDLSKEGFKNWKLMSVLTWGENPRGIWTVEIVDKVGKIGNKGEIGPATLILHGTNKIPLHMMDGPRLYDQDYNRVHKKTAISSQFEEPLNLSDLTREFDSLDWEDLINVPLTMRNLPQYRELLQEYWVKKLQETIQEVKRKDEKVT